MKPCSLAAFAALFVFFLLLCAFQPNAHADLLSSCLPGIGPGIGEAIGLSPGETPAPNGTVIFVPAVQVSRIHIRGWSTWWVRDTEEPVALTIVDGVPSALRLNEIVDIQGRLYWAGNEPCLTDVRCWAMTDSVGNILYDRDFPQFRGTMTEPWPYRTELEVPHNVALQPFGRARVLDDDPAPPGGSGSGIMPIYCETINDAIQMYDPNATDPIMVALETRPMSVDSSGLTILEDDSNDQLPAIYENYGALDPNARINVVTGAITVDTASNYVLAVDSITQDQPAGYVQALLPSTILGARTYTSPTVVLVQNLQVYADKTMFPGSVYCELPARCAGCRIICDSSVNPSIGDIIHVTGKTGLDSTGEWFIDTRQSTDSAGAVSVDSSGQSALGPLGMPNGTLGGNLNHLNGQNVSPGLINMGLLVKAWGTVSYVDSAGAYFLLDDGSGVANSSGTTYKGVKVALTWPVSGKPAIVPPLAGYVLAVTGASSCESVGGTYYRVLRPRGQSDIVLYNPQDNANPLVTISTGSVLHIDSTGNSNMVVAGTASSSTVVTGVQMRIDSAANWTNANFTPGTSVTWTCPWYGITTGTHTIYVQAIDYAGRTGSTSTSVTVSNVSVTYCSSAGDGTTGSSWQHAFQTVGNAASAASSGSEIWVAEGLYQECVAPNPGVALYGGFSGTEDAREQRNWALNKTILDGDYQGTVVTVSGAQTTIDGFIIENGSSLYWDPPSGICCWYGGSPGDGSTIIENNIIRGNIGGGLYAGDPNYICAPSLIVADNVFIANGANIYPWLYGYGMPVPGAIYYDYSSSPISAQIVNNTIIENYGLYGGGIYLESGCEGVSVSNNIIAYNVGGGVFYDGSGTPVLTNNDVYGNDRYLLDPSIINSVGGGNYYGFTQLPSSDIQSDPQISNSYWGDWHIASTSPCRGQGATQAVLTSVDIDGNPREINSSVDIGAQECNGTDPVVGPPTRIYVKLDGSDDNPEYLGRCRSNYTEGVDLASNAGGGEVWVASGTYTYCPQSSYTMVEMKPFVALYGGLAVGDTSLAARNLQSNQTVLNGSGTVWPIVDAEVPGNVTLDGFTITSAGTDVADGMGESTNFMCATTSIANNTISGNSSTGIYCSYCPAVTILNNIVTGNSQPSGANSGSGIGCSVWTPYGGMFGSTINVSNNTISGNTGGYCGSGIFCDWVTATINANWIKNNSCDIGDSANGPTGGAGLSIWDSDGSSITNNVFANNITNSTTDFGIGGGQGGGAIYAAGNADLSIVNNTFRV